MIFVMFFIICALSGLIVLFEGRMGSGKSLLSTAYSVMELVNNDRKIVSNSTVFLPVLKNPETDEEYEMYAETIMVGDEKKIVEAGYVINDERYCRFEKLDYEKLVYWMENNTTLFNATLVIDEIYLFADCHLSSSGLNRLVSYLALQTRKRDLDLYINSQQYENMEVRLRRNVDIRFVCSYDKNTEWCSFKIIDVKSGKRSRRKYLYGPNWYPFFDTDEIPSLRPFHTKITL